MTLNEAKTLLTQNNIPFEICEFENEAEYYQHITLFPYIKKARKCNIIALIIRSINKKKDIELQFNAVDNDFFFEELHFGDFSFDMFNYNEDMLANDLLASISKIQSGYFAFIVANDLKNKRWLGDASYDLNDDDNYSYDIAIQKIRKPKGIFSKLFKSQKQYEIYDWYTYECIIK